jgi:2-dehydrotetronate isomerase
MPQFAANLSMMYNEVHFHDRFEAAARDGFKAVEFLFPYDHDMELLATLLRDHGLRQVLFNAPPGGTERESISQAWQQGTRGIAILPERQAEFRQGFELALRYADALDCPRIHVMAGLIPQPMRPVGHGPVALQTSSDLAAQPGVLRDTYSANLRWAAQQAALSGRDVLIEPINTRDIPHFFLNRQAHAHAIIEEVGAGNLKVQMDLYHCQIVEGDVASKIAAYLPTGRVGHFQIAGVPQRHEPDVGELHHPHLFEVIDQVSASCGWQGHIGCEYRPLKGGQPGGTSDGLGWWRSLPR